MNGMDEKFKAGEVRFSNIDATLEVFTKLRNAWATKRKMYRNFFYGCLIALLLPTIGGLIVECVKHWLGWKQ